MEKAAQRYATNKGIALAAARAVGFQREDLELIDRFINEYDRQYNEFMELSLLEDAEDKINDARKVFHQQAENKRNDRHYYRNLVLRSVASFFVGVILSALLKTFGLGVFLFGLILCLLGAAIVYFG